MSSYLFVSYSSILYSVFNERICQFSTSLPLTSPSRGVFALGFIDLGWRNFRLVGSSGLEPPTSRLSGARSNHLSYEPTLVFGVSLSLEPLPAFCRLVEMMGIEPMTPCLQGRCSPSWATPPYRGYFIEWMVTQNWTTNESSMSIRSCTPLAVFFGFCLFPNYNVSDTLYLYVTFSIERRWSSRTFRYGYLVTT